MKISITYRLFLVILAAAGLAVISMFLIMQWSIDRGFYRFVNSMEQTQLTKLAGQLEENYARQSTWGFLKNDQGEWRRLLASSQPEDESGPPDHERPEGQGNLPPDRRGAHPHGPPHLGRDFAMRVVLVDYRKKPLAGPAVIPGNASLKPLRNQGRIVGYLGLLPSQRLSDESQLRFLNEQKLALSLGAGMIVLVAAGLSLPLANRLVRPIKALTAATDRLAAGEFATRVPVTSTDELGHLARDFNSLALTLEKNEQARRQWVADISHELRTPLAILRGEIEALQDGVRQPTPGSINSLHCEALRLGRLVDDLYQLSLSDIGAMTYRKEELDLAQLLVAAFAPYRSEFVGKNIAFTTGIHYEKTPVIFGDSERLQQLFANLFENALKYTDPGGQLEVRLACHNGLATIDVEDSAPGVQDKELDRLFERLYRVEASRNRTAGGAGLGLAICRNIVEAHAGTIMAHPSSLGGVWIEIILPLTGKC